MAQVWSSSTVHFMVQDPLKAIICKVLNRKMCIFFQEVLEGGKQDSLIQFYVKNDLILICGHLPPEGIVEVGGLSAKWAASLHLRSSFPQEPGFPLRKQ